MGNSRKLKLGSRRRLLVVLVSIATVVVFAAAGFIYVWTMAVSARSFFVAEDPIYAAIATGLVALFLLLLTTNVTLVRGGWDTPVRRPRRFVARVTVIGTVTLGGVAFAHAFYVLHRSHEVSPRVQRLQALARRFARGSELQGWVTDRAVPDISWHSSPIRSERQFTALVASKHFQLLNGRCLNRNCACTATGLVGKTRVTLSLDLSIPEASTLKLTPHGPGWNWYPSPH